MSATLELVGVVAIMAAAIIALRWDERRRTRPLANDDAEVYPRHLDPDETTEEA